MLRIYDDSFVARRTRIKRLRVLSLFAGGVLCGGWLAGNGPQLELLSTATAARPAPSQPAPAGWCQAPSTSPLRMDCSLKLPELTRADGI